MAKTSDWYERKLKASAATDPEEKGRGDNIELAAEDIEILKDAWKEIAEES